MRACAITGALVVAVTVGASVPMACTVTTLSPDSPPDGAGSVPYPSPALPPTVSVPETQATETTEPSAAAPAPNAASVPPRTAADCKQLASEIINEPPEGGLVMNNATTSGDAGASDRLAPLMAIMRSERDAFRCCFGLWGKGNPGQSGKVGLTVRIKPNGELESAEVDPARSDVHSDAVTSCVVDAAKAISYPPSPSGKSTLYSHLFEFKIKGPE